MDTVEYEKRVAKLYRRFAPVARRYHYTFSRPSVTVGGTPGILFLGNHSSGKSSLVNELLGGSAVQDTGVAPTDDGFTVLMYGDVERDVCGPAVLEVLPEEFRALEAFGPALLQHLRVKVRNRELLRGVNLVDSPGMIDAAEGASARDYDFAGVVRRLAEICDLVFFLFDPEKPGTTGETVNVFAQSLRGMEFKLRVLPAPVEESAFSPRLIWHHSTHTDPFLQWVRGIIVDASRQEARKLGVLDTGEDR